jgi:electron transport complex protein RnfE
MNQTIRQFKNGIVDQNPVLVLLLGICPVLATSTTMLNAAGMGIAATAVLICSNLAVSALRRLVSENIRFIAFIVIVASFVTAVDYLLQAFAPALSESLGIFIPLITVNCIVLARAEVFARRNGVVRSALDGLAMGMGFLGALMAVAAIREILSAGTLFDLRVLPEVFPGITVLAGPPGGFFALGLVVAVMQFVRRRKARPAV